MTSLFSFGDSTAESRRKFLKTAALTGATLAGGQTLRQAYSRAAEKTPAASGKLKIKVAGYQYDRVAGLADGRVQIEGCEAQFEDADGFGLQQGRE